MQLYDALATRAAGDVVNQGAMLRAYFVHLKRALPTSRVVRRRTVMR
jgi:hypothetical protein